MSKQAMELALEALEKYDRLIAYQYNGTRPAMDALQRAVDNGCAAIAALNEAIKAQGEHQAIALTNVDGVVELFVLAGKLTHGDKFYTSAPTIPEGSVLIEQRWLDAAFKAHPNLDLDIERFLK